MRREWESGALASPVAHRHPCPRCSWRHWSRRWSPSRTAPPVRPISTAPTQLRGRLERSASSYPSARNLARYARAHHRRATRHGARTERRRRKPRRRFRQHRERAVARSAPDGYTLLFTSNSIATLPALLGPRAVDPLTALAPVAMVAAQPMVVVVHPSFTGSASATSSGPRRARRARFLMPRPAWAASRT